MQMRFTLFAMEIDEEIYNPGNIRLQAISAHNQHPASASCNSFGGVRHGFNMGSNRASPYPPMADMTPRRLAPMRSVTSSPFPNIKIRNLPVQQSTRGTSLGQSRISSEEVTSMSMEPGPACTECGCHREHILPNPRSVPNIDLAEAAFNIASQSARIAVNDLLNSASPNENEWENGDPFSGRNNATVDISETGRARTISTGSLMSVSTASVLQPASSSASSRITLIIDLYYTCRDATESYISGLRPVRRNTSSSASHRHHPYAQDLRPRASSSEGRSRTLMDNISAICTHMWRRARSDILAPHRAEARAVINMRDLYAWSEMISRAFQSDDLEDSDLDTESVSESVRGSLCSGMGIDMWTVVGHVAMRLCEWLGDDEALRTCERIVNEIKELKEMGDGGVDFEDFGSIL